MSNVYDFLNSNFDETLSDESAKTDISDIIDDKNISTDTCSMMRSHKPSQSDQFIFWEG